MRASLLLLRPLAAFVLPLGIAACFAALSPPAPSPPASASGPFLWVSNEGSGDVALLDAGRGELVARVPVGKRPRGLRLDAAKGILYAAVSGKPLLRQGILPAAPEEVDRGADGIAAVDLATRQRVAILPAGPDPESFDLLPGGLLVVANEETASVTFVDAGAGRLASSLPVGDGPQGVTASPDGRLVAVSFDRAHHVDLVDTTERRVVARLPTCRRPRGVAFTPDGAVAFAACEDEAALAVLDAAARRNAGEVALPEGSRPTALAMDRAGQRVFVSNGRAGTVSAVDVAARRVAATSPVFGQRVAGLALGPDGRLYAADGAANEVVVLDAASLAVLRRMQVTERPWAVAVVP